jgi:O-antigen ligase
VRDWLDPKGVSQANVLFAVVLALPWLIPFAPGPSPATVPWLLTLGIAAGLLLLVGLRVNSPCESAYSYAALFAWGWLLAGLGSSVIGVLQYYGAAEPYSPWLSHAAFGEAYANLRQRNHFATLTNVALASLIWLEYSRPAGGHRWLPMLAASLLSVGNAASASRTGLVQVLLLCVASGIWGYWSNNSARRTLIAAILAYFLATVLLPLMAGMDPSLHGLVSRLRSGDEACASRLTLWANVIELIALRPWAGWGWGELDYAHYMTQYEGPRFCQILDNAHNLPLHLAVELGVPAALLGSSGVVWWVARQHPLREKDAVRQLAWAVLFMIALHSLLEYPLWYGPFQMATLICLGILWGSGSKYLASSVRLYRVRAAALAMALLGACAYALWDYHRVSQIYLPVENRSPAYRTDTLAKIRGSRIFANQVAFAELTITPLTSANAQWTYDTAKQLLHYSPEPKVIEKVIESATMLGRDEEAIEHLARYRAAFPDDYVRWATLNSFKSPTIRPDEPTP